MNEKLKLPVGWKEKRLKDVGKCLTGLTYTPSDVTDDSGLLVLRSSNVQGGKLVFEDNTFVQRDVNIKNYSQCGDILICVRNGSKNLIGKNAIITEDGAGLPHGAFMMLFRSSHNQYLFDLFSSEMYDKQVHRNLGATINSINSSDFYKFKFILPPLPEQKAIADILQTWDTAIEKTEALIAAKEKRFDWLLHNLIIKNRVYDTSSEWHKTNLGNICSVRTGQSAPQDETLFSPKGIPFIRVSSLDYLLGKSNSKKIEYISEEIGEKLNFQLFDEGTLVFAKSGMSALQSRIHKLSEPSFIVSHLCALTPKNSITGNYLEHYLKLYHPNRLIQGDGFPSIRTSEVSSFPIWLPSLPEQKRIAETLNTARQEIDTLKTLADRYRTQKRGLMQKLLTGKWMVKVKEAL